jgi:dTDP-4-amino-4,6-dideoxygalactose transaminase
MRHLENSECGMITVTKPDLPKLEKYVGYLKKIWSTRWLTNNGEFLQLLEKRIEEYLEIQNLLLVSNGTIALQLALNALDLEGEVITTPFTFAATTNVILWKGLTPVYADLDPDTFNIDPKEVEKRITEKTGAILAVHIYGNPCYVEELQEIADEHNLKLIFDAAQAFGVENENQSVLKYGDISTLSFHATKVFNTIEGGAIIPKDEELFEKLRLMRNHGIKSEEEVVLPGINARMNEFQAAMGLCNLENVDERIQSRKTIYEDYKEKLGDINKIKFQKIIASKYNYSYMPICFENIEKRDEIHSELIMNRIKSRKYFFPLTVNFDYFTKKDLNLVEKYNLKNASEKAERVLCLPLYPDLEKSSVEKIIDVIKNKI